MEPFVGTIMLFGFDWAPSGWLKCDGSLVSQDAHPALYSVIGTTYGGNPSARQFALPDLRGRVPLCVSERWPIATSSGSESVQLVSKNLPPHFHLMQASPIDGGLNTVPGPGLEFGVANSGIALYAPAPGPTQSRLSPTTIGITGGNAAHNNMMPTLVANYCIAYRGITPSQS